MKTLIAYSGLALLLGAGILPLAAQSGDQAVLVRLEGQVRQARVEAYNAEANRWIAIASGYREAADPGWLKIALPAGYDSASLRVMVNEQVSPFAGKMGIPEIPEAVYADYPPSARNFMMEDTAGGGGSSEPVIEEADIWAWQDSILYFYNQYRGLQVLDLSNPSQPAWLDYYRYPAKGEDLYSMGDGRVVLIGTGSYWRGENLTLQFMDFDGDSLSLADSVELPAGYYMDSRRYNDFLYVMTREWVEQLDPDNRTINAPRIHLYTVALGDGVADRIVDEKTFNGDGWLDAVLTAQPDGVLLSLNKWYRPHDEFGNYGWRTEVHVLVPGADGIPEEAGVARLSGILHDKYKIRYRDGVLTTIAQQADWSTGRFSRNTRLENFQLGSGGFTRVGSLDLAPGENLFATRFYGDNVYVVTFLFVDPLFSIDNSDPAHPVIAGELEVPGWSNYIEWVDGYLFAVGIEESQLTVSMFDVADPASMSLLDREYLGEESWAWSEAQYDDQAISFFPEPGLMMLPFTAWSWKSPEMIQAMQLLSWDDTGLALRGQIQHLDVPRRGVLRGQTVVTISGREVVTTDVADPDVPALLGQSTLAWNVQHLLRQDGYLLQLESLDNSYGYFVWRYPYNYESQLQPVLYVTSLAEPNMPEAEIPLEEGIILGVAKTEDRLVLLQDVSPVPETDYWTVPEKQSLAVRVYDLTDPLQPGLLGESLSGELPYLGNRFESELLADGTVLWYTGSTPFYGFYMLDFWPGPWYYQNALSYLVSGMDTAGAPSIETWDTYPVDNYWNQASSWFREPPLLIASLTQYFQHDDPEGRDRYKVLSSLLAVDFSDPVQPLELPPCRLPGQLSAVRPLNDGLDYYLYFEPKWNVVSVWGWDRANAFPLFEQQLEEDQDGSSSYTIDWMAPFQLRNRYIYGESESTNYLDAWYHDAAANRFRRAAEFKISNDWISNHAVKDMSFLMTTYDEAFHYKGNAQTGSFVLKDKEGLPFPNLYTLNLEQSVATGLDLYIPAGMYGVEEVRLTFLEPPDGVDYPAAGSVVEAAWVELDPTGWRRSNRSSSDAAGIMNRLQWMYRADNMPEPDPAAVDAGDLWRDSDWFGWYAHDAGRPDWIRHLELGPLWIAQTMETGGDGLYLCAPGIGMVWTRPDLYPYLYSFKREQWIHYARDTGLTGRSWFYDLSQGWFGLVNGR